MSKEEFKGVHTWRVLTLPQDESCVGSICVVEGSSGQIQCDQVRYSRACRHRNRIVQNARFDRVFNKVM